MAVKVRKKGFSQRAKYPAPQWALDHAIDYVERFVANWPETLREVHAELRCAPYIGTDRSCYTLTVNGYFKDGGDMFLIDHVYEPLP